MTVAVAHELLNVCGIASASLISAAWEGGLLVLAVVLALRLLPRATAVVRSATWTALLLVFIALPFICMQSAANPSFGHAAALRAPKIELDPRWSFAPAALWAILSLVRAVSLSRSALHLHAIRKRSNPVDAVEATRLIGTAGASSGAKVYRNALLCTSDDVSRPSVIGFFSPRILIPTDLYHALAPEELTQIVLHEMEHLRRRDDWINLVQKIGLVVFPLNPALLWVERRLCLERELACDEGVLQATRAPKKYATCLVRLAEQNKCGRQISLALGAWERRSELARRVHRILEPRASTLGRTEAAAITSVLVLGLLGGATILSQTPQMVSFMASPLQSRTAASSAVLPSAPYREVRFSDPGVSRPRMIEAGFRLPMAVPAKNRPTTKHSPRSSAPGKQRSSAPGKHVTREHLRAARPLVLTSWAPVAGPAAGRLRTRRIAIAIFDTYPAFSSYAAVSTADGWLIVQL